MGEAHWPLKRLYQAEKTSEDEHNGEGGGGGAAARSAKKGRVQEPKNGACARRFGLLDFTTDLLVSIIGKLDPGQQLVVGFVCKRLRDACSRVQRHWTYYTEDARRRTATALRSAIRTGSTRLLDWFERSFGRAYINAVSWEKAGIDATAGERLAIVLWRLKRHFGAATDGISVCDLMVAAASSRDRELFGIVSFHYARMESCLDLADIIRVHRAMLSAGDDWFIETEAQFYSSMCSASRVHNRMREAGLATRIVTRHALLGGGLLKAPIAVPQNILVHLAPLLDKERIAGFVRARFVASPEDVVTLMRQGHVTAAEHVFENAYEAWIEQGRLQDWIRFMMHVAMHCKAAMLDKIARASTVAIDYRFLARGAAYRSNVSTFAWACERLNGELCHDDIMTRCASAQEWRRPDGASTEAAQISFMDALSKRFGVLPKECHAVLAAKHGRLELLKWIVGRNPSLGEPEKLERYFSHFLGEEIFRLKNAEAMERIFVQQGLLPFREERRKGRDAEGKATGTPSPDTLS